MADDLLPLVMDASSNSHQQPMPPSAPMSAMLALLRDPYDFFVREAQRKHGDIFVLKGGLTSIIVLNHPQYIDDVLRRRAKNFTKGGAMWDAIRALLGNGLVVSDGDVWRRRRRMMQPHFGRARLAALTDAIAVTIDEVVETWAARTHEPVNMADLCPHMTMLVMVRAVFGTDIREEDIRTVATDLRYVLGYIARGLVLQRVPAWLPLPGR